MHKSLMFSFLLLFIGCASEKNNIVGVWQNSPVMASGWNDTYQFYRDGRFNFNFNTMDCQKRIVMNGGTYELSPDGKISLTVQHRFAIIGGTLVPAKGGCASEFQIEGGAPALVKVVDQEKITLPISKVVVDKDNKEKITINGVDYWRFDKDPEGYTQQ